MFFLYGNYREEEYEDTVYEKKKCFPRIICHFLSVNYSFFLGFLKFSQNIWNI